MLWSIGELPLFMFITLGFFIAIEIGFQWGFRNAHRADDFYVNHFNSLQAALLGLVALLLSFAFSMSIARFDTRKMLVIDEANAIGTTYLRAQFLAEPFKSQAISLLNQYTEVRLAFYDAGINESRLLSANSEAAAIQQKLWQLTVSSAKGDPHSITSGLFIDSLNTLIDLNEKRQAALNNHVPEPVIWLLFAVSCVAMAFVAYSCGLRRTRRLAVNWIFAVIIAIVLTLTLDVDRPRRGLVLVSQDSLLRLKSSLEQTTP